MKKTISLKLTSQEEEIIDSMRNIGIAPSTILRESFWKYVADHETQIWEKPYKEVNQKNHFHKENLKTDDRKVYNKVNQVNQEVSNEPDLFREKVVYQPVNQVNDSHGLFLNQYIDQLHRQIQHLESDLHDWKMRHAIEIQQWKESYAALQTEYQNQVKDSMKCIDDKFNQIMFYFEEAQKTSLHTFEVASKSDVLIEKQKKKWMSQKVRM